MSCQKPLEPILGKLPGIIHLEKPLGRSPSYCSGPFHSHFFVNMLKIADQVFDIDSSRFIAYVSLGEHGWATSWSLEFAATEREIEGMDWKPEVSPHAFALDLPSPRSLPGFKTCLPDCDDQEEPMFILYVFEHGALRNVELEFGEWDQQRISFTLKGVADVHADDPYFDNLPVEISLVLPFDGVVVDEGSIDKAIERFLMFFDMKDFAPPETRADGSGFVFRPAIRQLKSA